MVILTAAQYTKVLHPFVCKGADQVPHLPYARHCTLALALKEHPGEPQIWIDADTVPSVSDLTELQRIQNLSQAGVVSGWYLRHGTSEPVGCPKPGGFYGDYCDMLEIGFGCVLIMPSVWPTLARSTWEIETKMGVCPAVFSDVLGDRFATMEDHAFSIRCRQAHIRMVAATGVCPKHYRSKGVFCSEFVKGEPEQIKTWLEETIR
jgi:hypothetical protein